LACFRSYYVKSRERRTTFLFENFTNGNYFDKNSITFDDQRKAWAHKDYGQDSFLKKHTTKIFSLSNVTQNAHVKEGKEGLHNVVLKKGILKKTSKSLFLAGRNLKSRLYRLQKLLFGCLPYTDKS